MNQTSKTNNKSLAVLMATYNGEKYIRQQINSLLSQTNNDFTLFIRDDNSTDNTKNIINEYVLKYPDKIMEVKDNKITKGPFSNFLTLLEYVYSLNKYNFFMFCDQDDVWFNDKIETTLNEYDKIENKNKPIFIYSDAYVTNKELEIMNKSFIMYANLRSDYKSFNNYLVQNNALGCTVFINKNLVDLIKFDIKNIIMHDWYCAIIASAFGSVKFINKPTMYYRQHPNNVCGAKKSKIYDKLIKDNRIKKDYEELFMQAEYFRNAYYDILSDDNKKVIDAFCSMKNSSKLTKLKTIKKYKFYKQGFGRILAELVFI